MGRFTLSRGLSALGWVATFVMALAGIGMFHDFGKLTSPRPAAFFHWLSRRFNAAIAANTPRREERFKRWNSTTSNQFGDALEVIRR